ncbi:MAG: substrate-binding domain-containing protein [Candidatus Marinimicrobia bacterium]|nr:substrate-binding domain-containing protein [Candidatus Neomarinimicrobiota bacterium]MCF7840346.1 substrate-binding domain-containing protein [Candidatus Neomarinimicrobiota bacterium]MCF7902410.1 substrate-binding domain-containing protein [Candidatus Neomarinimicrobiota bacterium]
MAPTNRNSSTTTDTWRGIFQYTLVLLIFVGLIIYALCTAWLSGRGSGTRSVIIYGFSILGEAMNQEILPTFQQQWLEKTGEDIGFITSFAGSGEITEQLVKGVPAEIAILSTESDAMILMEKGVIRGPTWKNLPHAGILNRSPIVILVRPGNPHQISDFSDLTSGAFELIHPHPFSSGGAKWAILAEYGSAWLTTGNFQLAVDQLTGIWQQVAILPVSVHQAMNQFQNSVGDVLITYEQSYLRGKALQNLGGEVVYPQSTIFSEHTVIRLDKHINAGQEELVDRLLQFLWSREAQAIFVSHGFRSVDDGLNTMNPAFGHIDKPFTIQDLGGWQQVDRTIFQEVWRDKIFPQMQNAHK